MTAVPAMFEDVEWNGLLCSSTRPFHAVEAPRVLIVEDDRDVHRGWRVFLGHQGYEVLSAYDGAEGLAMIEGYEPAVVLLDLGLGGMHGMKVLHEARMRALAARIVVVTATATPDVERAARALGACAVVGKPTPPRRLVELIEGLLAG